jgi:carbon starvation protein
MAVVVLLILDSVRTWYNILVRKQKPALQETPFIQTKRPGATIGG